MKKIILLAALLVCTLAVSTAAKATADKKSVNVANVEVIRMDNSVIVSFALNVGEQVTQSNRSLIISPVLRSSGGQIALAPIIIRGSRAKVSAEDEAMSAAGIVVTVPFYTANGQTVDYMTSVPWQEWMDGSELILSGINAGKGKATEVNIGLVADNLLREGTSSIRSVPAVPERDVYVAEADARKPVGTEPEVSPAEQTASQTTPPRNPAVQAQNSAANTSADQGKVVQRPLYSASGTYNDSSVSAGQSAHAASVGDELAAKFPFVEPVAKFHRARQQSTDIVFDYNMPLTLGTGVARQQNETEQFIDMTRDGALLIQFQRGSHVIGRDLGENNKMLVNLISSIHLIESSRNARIAQVIVVGFSSPDGTSDENDRLAMERAVVARDFLTANSSISPNAISIYNGSVDWSILRDLVAESNMADKYKILEIIDNTPAWGRLGRLIELNNGAPYRYMQENFFQQLRQTGVYVKVYYENTRS